MTQALSRRDQFALAAMAKLMERKELSVDAVAAMAALQADVMVKRLDADPREDDGCETAPSLENIARYTKPLSDMYARRSPSENDPPSDSYETSEGVTVRIKEDTAAELLADVERTVDAWKCEGETIRLFDALQWGTLEHPAWRVPAMYGTNETHKTYTAYLSSPADVPTFLSRARRALA